MSRKQEIEKAITKVFKRQSAFGDEDKDAAKITVVEKSNDTVMSDKATLKIKVDKAGFDEAFKHHQELDRISPYTTAKAFEYLPRRINMK